MTYISAQLSENKQNVLVWERLENGERNCKIYRAPYYFYYPDENGQFLDIYNNKLDKMEFSSYRDFYSAKEELKRNGIQLYESDISPEYKILMDKYYGKPSGKLNVTFFDIEVTKDPAIGWATMENPYAPICSVAIYHQYNDTMIIYAVPPTPSWTIEKIPKEVKDLAEIVLCKNEEQLLRFFLAEIEATDLLSGWNSSLFDIPYIYFRLMRLFGDDGIKKLGFCDARLPKEREIERFGRPCKVIDIFGRISLDYLDLFRKLEQNMRQSYKLEAIAEEFLPDLPKLTYEGSLQKLYEENFPYFLKYNIRDTEILRGLDSKLKYIQFAIDFSHLSTSEIDDVLGTVKLTELAIINFCHKNRNKKVRDSHQNVETIFAGAAVLETKIGLYKNVSGVDVRALYPSMMKALNISPETIIGQFVEKNKAFEEIKNLSNNKLLFIYEDGKKEELMAREWKDKIISKGWNLSGFGTILTQEFVGIIPEIVSDWGLKREEYKAEIKKKQKIKKKLTDDQEINKIQEEIEYFDKLQYMMKIRGNSVYGVLGNAYFKFYDLRNAESITRSGREVFMHQARFVANEIDGEYAYPSESIIGGDTDSCLVTLKDDNLEDCIKTMDNIRTKLNNSFSKFLIDTFFIKESFSNYVQSEWEYIADKAIFAAKKNYAMHIVYKDDKNVDDMKIMGLAVKKTGIPKVISKKLISHIKDFLLGKPWYDIGKELVGLKDELKMIPILEIGLPKGIKNVEQYTDNYEIDEKTRLPGHVAAAIHWNKCIKEYRDMDSEPITSGSKLKTFYLKKKFGRFKSIAVPTDLRIVPQWFKDNFEHLIDKNAQIERLIDKPFESILKAIKEKMPTKKSLLIDDIGEY